MCLILPARLVPNSKLFAWVLGLLGWSAAWGAIAPDGFQNLPIPEEVSAHLTTSMVQDSQGFIWLGTQKGLLRYDGQDFRSYRSNPYDPTTLGGSYVRTLLEASDGRLWVGTFGGGLSVFDPETDLFQRFVHDPNDKASLCHDHVEGLAEDSDGRIWIATNGCLGRLDPTTEEIVQFKHREGDSTSLGDNRVRGLLVDRKGRLWVGSRAGLQRFLGDEEGFASINLVSTNSSAPTGQFVTKIIEDIQGRLWIATPDRGAFVFDPETESLHRLLPESEASGGLSHYWVYDFAELSTEMWIATFGGGIDVVNLQTLQVEKRLKHDPALPSSIAGDRIGALLKDRSGVLWVATWGQGINLHNPANRAFQTFRYSPHRPRGLSHKSIVRPLELADGTLWLGTNGNGVDVFDLERGLVKGFRPDPENSNALADGSVTCMAQSEDGAVWVATLDGTLHRIQPGQNRFQRITVREGLPGGPIRTMAFGPDDSLWVGSSEGLARVGPKGNIAAYHHRSGDPTALASDTVEALLWDPKRKFFWVGTDQGLDAFHPERGVVAHLEHELNNNKSLPSNWVPDLLRTSTGQIWVATEGGACLLQEMSSEELECLPTAQLLGRPTVSVTTLLEDSMGAIWLGPRLRVQPEDWTYQEFNFADGMVFKGFFIASRLRSQSGHLLFGSPEGLLVVDPSKLQEWYFNPPIVATALRVGGHPLAGASRRSRIVLMPGETSFGLDFASLDFSAPHHNRYRFRLQGLTENWEEADAAHRSQSFTNLKPGFYRLEVQGTNRVGRWSSHKLTLDVEVRPKFYQTFWFRALVLAILSALIYLGIRLRVSQLKRRSQRLEQLVGQRTLDLLERRQELAVKNQELEAAYARIEEVSLTDLLTKIRNRRFLEQTIEGDVEIVLRRHQEDAYHGERDLVFFLLDLDHFKRVNDTYGHAAGDRVLEQTAEILTRIHRSSDYIVRWGGEEFLVVVRFTDRREVADLAEKIRSAIADHEFDLGGGETIRLSCSLGSAAFPFAPGQPRAVHWEQVVDLADAGMYCAKSTCRDAWVGLAMGSIEGTFPTLDDCLQGFRKDPRSTIHKGALHVQHSRGMVPRWGGEPTP